MYGTAYSVSLSELIMTSITLLLQESDWEDLHVDEKTVGIDDGKET